MICDSKEAVGGGADRDTRGRVCSPEAENCQVENAVGVVFL
jgi:hypothetical protein